MGDVLRFQAPPGSNSSTRAEITRVAHADGDKLRIGLRRRQGIEGDAVRFLGEVGIDEKRLAWQTVARAAEEAGVRYVLIGPGVRCDDSPELMFIRRNSAPPPVGGSAV